MVLLPLLHGWQASAKAAHFSPENEAGIAPVYQSDLVEKLRSSIRRSPLPSRIRQDIRDVTRLLRPGPPDVIDTIGFAQWSRGRSLSFRLGLQAAASLENRF